jgi:3-deoxy-D-manno-octulosonate 8-phosphate phosphatase (KDO 8-P phosphatase)
METFYLGLNALEIFSHIDTFVFDVDGILTDNQLLVLESGEGVRSFNVKDGYILKYALGLGHRICIITGGKGVGLVKRLEGLGIYDIYLGVEEKGEVLKRWMKSHNVNPATTMYMGDDVPDLSAMRLVGLPCCPTDAVPEVIEMSRYVSPLKGGEGCVRDVMEKIFRVQGKWNH